jgi:outer membrane protein
LFNFLMTPTEIAMQKPLIAVLIASAFLTLNAQAADLLQVYQQALANDATYASARSSLAAGQERITQGRSGLLPPSAPAAAICAITASSSRNEGVLDVVDGYDAVAPMPTTTPTPTPCR